MRFIIYGTGAIGGVVGAGLFRSGHVVVLIARGAHYRAIKENGLQLNDPEGDTTYPISVVEHPRDIDFRPDDVVVMAMKGQDTLDAMNDLARVAPSSIAVVCAQNGVENERVALRFFEHVYGVCVAGGTAYIEPGVVMAEAGPIFGCLEIGRYPAGLDDRVHEIVEALSASWVVVPQDHVMEWKYTKMMRNLVLAVQALCGASTRHGPFYNIVRAEGEACLRAAGIDFVDDETWSIARTNAPKVMRPLMDAGLGGSSWQSLARGTGSIETAYLNGEVLLLSRRFGVPAPANALLYELGMRAAATGQPPGTMTEDELLGLLGA